jgi:hypothetical protein
MVDLSAATQKVEDARSNLTNKNESAAEKDRKLIEAEKELKAAVDAVAAATTALTPQLNAQVAAQAAATAAAAKAAAAVQAQATAQAQLTQAVNATNAASLRTPAVPYGLPGGNNSSSPTAPANGVPAGGLTVLENAARAQAVAQYGREINRVGREMEAAGKELAKYNPMLGDQIELYGGIVREAGRATSTIARGFAAGGPVGAGIAAVAEAVTILAEAWEKETIAQAKAAEELQKGLGDIREGYQKLRESRGEIIEDGFLEHLHEEGERLKFNNGYIEASIKLLEARKRAEADIATSQINLKIAQIKADTGLNKEEKARMTGEEEQKLARIRAQSRLDEINNRVTSAKSAAGARGVEVGSADRTVADLEKRISDLQGRLGLGPSPNLSARDRAQYDTEQGELQRARTQLPAAEKEAQKARQALAEAQRAAEVERLQGRIAGGAVIGTYRNESQARGFQTEESARKAAEQDRADNEKVAREKEQEARKREADKRRRDSRENRADGAGNRAGSEAFRLAQTKGLSDDQRGRLQQIGQRLQTNPQSRDLEALEKIAHMLEQRAGADSAQDGKMKQLINRLTKLEQAFSANRQRSK